MQREIEKNINLLKSRIEQVSQNSEKSISEIGIIAVSKKKSLEHIKIAFNLGLKDFGENYLDIAMFWSNSTRYRLVQLKNLQFVLRYRELCSRTSKKI